MSIIYKDTEYDSKAAVVRAMFLAGDIDNSPEQKKRVATLLCMTVQTVHATLVKMNGKPAQIEQPKVFVDSYENVRQAIENRFNECYKIAESKGVTLNPIRIDWSLRGAVAGQFRFRFFGRDKCFRVNLALAKDNLEDYLRQTVPHEFCHYLTFAKLGINVQHSHAWKRAMIHYFGLEPRRCHDYDVSQVQRKVQRYEYNCKCRKIIIGAVRHHRLRMNPTRYTCRACGSYLTFVKPC